MVVRVVSFELTVLQFNIRGFYLSYISNEKEKNTVLTGEKILTFYGVCHGLDTVREVLSYIFSSLDKVTIMIEFY